jgi:hypothetical protein
VHFLVWNYECLGLSGVRVCQSLPINVELPNGPTRFRPVSEYLNSAILRGRFSWRCFFAIQATTTTLLGSQKDSDLRPVLIGVCQ